MEDKEEIIIDGVIYNKGALFDELDIIIEDFFAAYERFKEERKQKEGKNVQS